MSTRLAGRLIGFVLLSLVTGCATMPQRAELPLGEWSGRGVFIVDTWAATWTETQPESQKHQYGQYPTSLKIAHSENGRPGALRIEIVSQRGPIEQMEGDRTHVVAELEPGATLPDPKFALYRLAGFAIALDEKPPKTEKGPGGPTHATCMVVDNDVVFRIQYLDRFTDTLRFHGDVVYKDGTFYSEKLDGFIHWSEVLRK